MHGWLIWEDPSETDIWALEQRFLCKIFFPPRSSKCVGDRASLIPARALGPRKQQSFDNVKVFTVYKNLYDADGPRIQSKTDVIGRVWTTGLGCDVLVRFGKQGARRPCGIAELAGFTSSIGLGGFKEFYLQFSITFSGAGIISHPNQQSYIFRHVSQFLSMESNRSLYFYS